MLSFAYVGTVEGLRSLGLDKRERPRASMLALSPETVFCPHCRRVANGVDVFRPGEDGGHEYDETVCATCLRRV